MIIQCPNCCNKIRVVREEWDEDQPCPVCGYHPDTEDLGECEHCGIDLDPGETCCPDCRWIEEE